jgi:hypothetical protein
MVAEVTDLSVGRPKVVAPVGDTMRLIHDQEGKTEPSEARLEPPTPEAFRREKEKLGHPAQGTLKNLGPLGGGKGGTEEVGPDAHRPRPGRLVFHQGDEGAHHQDRSGEERRRELKTDALSPARGEDAEGVPTVEGCPDQRLLSRPEARVAQGPPEEWRQFVGPGGPSREASNHPEP